MKTILAFTYFIGSILIIFVLLWLGFLLAPPEFVLDKELITVERGVLRNSERLFPNLQSKQAFQYPGTLAGLAS